MSNPSFFVHPSSVVDSGARVGEGTRIWHFCHIMSGATVGRQCSVGQNVFVASGVRIGDHVKIQNNVSLYEGVTLEDDVFCGPSMVFTNVINPRSHVVRKSEYQSTKVRKGATLGANCTVICGVEIGRYAFVGAGAVVSRNVPDYALVYGNPTQVRGWMCACGIKLSLSATPDGRERAVCSSCGLRFEKEGMTVREVS